MPRKAKDEINHSSKSEIKEKKTTVTKSRTSTAKKSAPNVATKKTASKTGNKKAKVNTAKKTDKSNKIQKSTNSKISKKTNTVKKKKAVSSIVTEYYDLPFRYNQTVVKILAQTPNILFIYWDISDDDRKSLSEKYGEDFFNNTKPFLVVTNETMHYTFEVEINDFANSWYLHVNDANCEYKVELVRKYVNDDSFNYHSHTEVNNQNNQYVYISSSNELETPNNHILFDKLSQHVFFRNVKTNVIQEKNISSLSFLQRLGKVYHIYDLYKEIYQDELMTDEFGINLPSSNSSPTFK